MKLDAYGLLLLVLGIVLIVGGLAISWRLIVELLGLVVLVIGIVAIWMALSRG